MTPYVHTRDNGTPRNCNNTVVAWARLDEVVQLASSTLYPGNYASGIYSTVKSQTPLNQMTSSEPVSALERTNLAPIATTPMTTWT